MGPRPDTADAARQRILDAALALGEQVGWDRLRMFELAQALDMTLADLQRHFDGKDAIAEAWFDRADQALLAIANAPGWMLQTPRQRLERAIFAWLDALAEHRRLTGAMLRYKLQPEHLHLQALGLMRISRTVQWIREVAGLPNAGWRRELEEAALTTIYLTTFATWLRDDSPGSARTHAHLDRALALAERAATRFGPTPDRRAARQRDAQPVDSGYGEPLGRDESAPD